MFPMPRSFTKASLLPLGANHLISWNFGDGKWGMHGVQGLHMNKSRGSEVGVSTVGAEPWGTLQGTADPPSFPVQISRLGTLS